MDNKEAEWTNFFNRAFTEVKKIVFGQYQLEKDGSGPPETLALREVVAKFPCPLRIAEIRIDTEKHKHIRDEICQIIRYDFSKLGVTPRTVEYYNIVDARDSEKLRELLIKKFNLNEISFGDFYRDFRTIGWCDDEANFYVQFPLYDIKNNLREFVFDFMVSPFDFFLGKIRQKFGKGVDWNSKFNLRPDPILPISEITKMDETLGAFLPFSEGAGIEKLQEDICNIQLIPSVPEDVKKVFRHAKNLHIYGFFRYNFFAITQHYAYLALESAIKNRYYQSFGKENTLENEKRETVRIGSIDHQGLIDLCKRMKWNLHKVRINGEKFAFNTGELLAWLVKRGIITEWERKQCDKGMRLRHLMSHLTRAYVFPPGYSVEALEFVADIINKLYSSSTGRTNNNSKGVFPLDFSPSRIK
jgi:hypothetical protein